MKKIYLAGFDVFAPDAKQRGAKMKMMCAEKGFVGLYPFDNEADTAQEIFAGNCTLIDSADIVIANLNPFRGVEPDSGTCFEVGYAVAKGKTVYGYVSDARSLREKLGERDENGFSVEDFGLPLNLMLSCSTHIVEGDFAAALAVCRAEQA
ncbi:MAG TPA: nucleoside 2-deoxyribosyltransferase [Candidatus Agathobaculum pullicola]|nr:nucleoside 2-deoxyribosyltransferase [Candidatus Agathobaculum pullicola]